MYEELGQPEVYFMDVQPIHRLLIVCSPAVAEQLTKPSSTHPYSVPKSYTMMDHSNIVGKTGLIVTNVRFQDPWCVCNAYSELLG